MYQTINKTGVVLAAGAASVNAAIPTTTGNALPRFIRITATGPVTVRIGAGSGTAALATDAMVQPGDALTLVVQSGMTHVAALQVSAAATVNVVPLEDS